MENEKRAVAALKKIEEAINEIRDIFPEVKKEKVKILPTKKYSDPIRILKTINGIIKNYTEENAERKLKSLLGFLKITLNKKK